MTTHVCFEQFLAESLKNGTDPVKVIAEEVKGVTPLTIKRWCQMKTQPLGEPLIQLRFMLERRGYRPAELQKLEPEALELGRLYAKGVVSLDDIKSLLQFDAPNGKQQALFLLHGGARILKSKMPRVRAFLEEHAGHDTPRKVSKQQNVNREQKVSAVDALEVMLQLAASQILSLTTVATFLASAHATQRDRQRLHEMVGEDGVLTLISRLKPLCSETALARSTTKR